MAINLLGFASALGDLFDDLPRWYSAVAECCACLVYIFVNKRRYKAWQTVLFSVLFCGVIVGLALLPVKDNKLLSVMLLVLTFVIMYTFITLCTNCTLLESGFLWARALVAAEFVASCEWQLQYFFATQAKVFAEAGGYVFMAVFYLVLFALLYFVERGNNSYLKVSRAECVFSMLIAVLVFLISNITLINPGTPFSSAYATEFFYIRTLVDLIGLLSLYIYQSQRISWYSRRNADFMEHLLENQRQKYLQSQEVYDQINYRYHDLKYHLQMLKTESVEERNKYIAELEEDIKQFESYYRTDNEVLDILLANESKTFRDNDIKFVCVADGKALSFMDKLDVYSLFGNALDNAVESLVKIADKDKRLLRMQVNTQNSFVFVKVQNYYEHNLVTNDGDFETTKKEKYNHGFGIKSMRQVVGKYNGTLEIDTSGNWFTVCVLIPRPTSSKSAN